jgi:hypothetical protein
MRQLRDTLVWLAMILVVAGVLYWMPRVASFVRAGESEQRPASISYRGVPSPYDGYNHSQH